MFILKAMFHHQISYLSYNEKIFVIGIVAFCMLVVTHRNQGINYDEAFAKDTQGLDILTGQFSHNIDRIWGVNELLVASRKDYVKYTDSFYTRSHVSFDEGNIVIETQQDPNRLHNAIVHTFVNGRRCKRY